MSSNPQRFSTAGAASLTQILQAASEGDSSAANEVFSQVYSELRSIAARHMGGERRDHSLGATALIHEAYVRLLGQCEFSYSNRASFFHAAAEAMRRILIEHARKRGRKKRIGQRRRLPLEVLDLNAGEFDSEILAVHEALERLEVEDAHVAEVVRLRFFAGLCVDEVATVLNSSPRSVARDWAFARAWLYRALGADGAD